MCELIVQAVPTYTVFVSYFHRDDQPYYDKFRHLFVESNVILDSSLLSPKRGELKDILRQIDEGHIARASCTLVLCGSRTYERQYVDWEIWATLSRCHGLIGVQLPYTLEASLPLRLVDNLLSGFAQVVPWSALVENPQLLVELVAHASQRDPGLIRNDRPLLKTNGVG